MTVTAKDNRGNAATASAVTGRPLPLGGAGKAAVLVLAMGKPLAGRMLKHLDTAEVRALMRRASELGPVAADDIADLVDEFSDQFSRGMNLVGSPSEA